MPGPRPRAFGPGARTSSKHVPAVRCHAPSSSATTGPVPAHLLAAMLLQGAAVAGSTCATVVAAAIEPTGVTFTAAASLLLGAKAPASLVSSG